MPLIWYVAVRPRYSSHNSSSHFRWNWETEDAIKWGYKASITVMLYSLSSECISKLYEILAVELRILNIIPAWWIWKWNGKTLRKHRRLFCSIIGHYWYIFYWFHSTDDRHFGGTRLGSIMNLTLINTLSYSKSVIDVLWYISRLCKVDSNILRESRFYAPNIILSWQRIKPPLCIVGPFFPLRESSWQYQQ